jgi:hypothetical protein
VQLDVRHDYPMLLAVVPVNAWKKGTYPGNEGSITPSYARKVRSSRIALCSTIFPSSPILYKCTTSNEISFPVGGSIKKLPVCVPVTLITETTLLS